MEEIEINLTRGKSNGVRDANLSGNVKTVGNSPEISEKKIRNIPKFFDL